MGRIYFLRRERLVHVDLAERGEPIKKNIYIYGRDTCNKQLGGRVGSQAGSYTPLVRQGQGWCCCHGMGQGLRRKRVVC